MHLCSADFETVRQIKEKVCYVGYDLAVERQLALETTTLVQSYTLPDGRVIKVNGACKPVCLTSGCLPPAGVL